MRPKRAQKVIWMQRLRMVVLVYQSLVGEYRDGRLRVSNNYPGKALVYLETHFFSKALAILRTTMSVECSVPRGISRRLSLSRSRLSSRPPKYACLPRLASDWG